VVDNVNSVKEIKINKITKKEKDWLIGLFLADGSKFIDIRTYRVSFYLNSRKDLKILEKLENILKKLGTRYDVQVKRKNNLEIRIARKRFFEFMPSKNEIYKFSSRNPESFIAGFLDGDGYISDKYGCIGFSQSIVKWIGPFISNYFTKKGIRPWKNTIYRNCFYYATSLKKIKEKTNIVCLMSKSN
jgi:intein/homing endonuclease